MATTYEPIATTTLSSAASSITFSSIPSTYTDLKLVLVARGDTAASTDYGFVRFNSDTGFNYSRTDLYGNGSTASSSNSGGSVSSVYFGDIPAASATSGMFGFIDYDIFSYAGSTYKTCLLSNSNDMNGSGQVRRSVGLWRSTSAINAVTIQLGSGNFVTGTTATIWGIKAA